MEIPVVEKEVQSHQPHYKVSEHPLSHSLNAFFPFLWAHPVFIIQMTLAPNYRLSPEDGKVLKTRKNRSAETAVTRYRILASSSACSLLELQPITGEVWPCLCIVTATQLLCALCLTVLSVQSGAVLEVGTSCRAWPRLWEVTVCCQWSQHRVIWCKNAGGWMAGVELMPTVADVMYLLFFLFISGVKHQIRVHLAYGLGCPILGDHKYSHWNKLAPQVRQVLCHRVLQRPAVWWHLLGF